MPSTRALRLHTGRVLWPEHKPEAEVLALQAETPELTWETTYQGNMVNPSGAVFLREWWTGKNRWSDRSDPGPVWISFDTAESEAMGSAYTAWCVGTLLPDYRLRLDEAGRRRVEFPQLVELIKSVAQRYQSDYLQAIIIEDKSSGKQAVQTLRQQAERWLAKRIIAYNPRVDKPMRWNQSASWCALGCVLLPHPGGSVPWLFEFEDELFGVPGSATLDFADAFAQLIIFTENLLSEGWRARSKQHEAIR